MTDESFMTDADIICETYEKKLAEKDKQMTKKLAEKDEQMAKKLAEKDKEMAKQSAMIEQLQKQIEQLKKQQA